MRQFKNDRRKTFLASLSRPSLDDDNNNLTIRCKFNFSYFISRQDAGQDFQDWENKHLIDLLKKLQNFSTMSIAYWKNLNVLKIYGSFPTKTDFVQPKNIPHQVLWGRFRLGSRRRLPGFTIPTELHRIPHKTTGEYFDKNTFYVVFLDRDHKFYLSENK